MTLDKTQTSPRASGGPDDRGAWDLRVVFPNECRGRVPLQGGTAWQVVGRGTGEGQIEHATVSRAHLAVRRRGMLLEVRDEGSHNGTWLNETKLGREGAFVGNDAVLRIGDTLAVIEARQEDDEGVDREALPGDAPCVRALRQIVGRVATSATHVLLLGETGTGKELAAQEVHRLSGRGALVNFNCAGLSAQLADSQLFGHDKGAFTGAERAHEGLFRRADGGTLFLDEIGELDPAVQAKLLRVLETGEVQPLGSDRAVSVDTRVVAATHPNLAERVREGGFRRDLHARLAVASAVVPPLRERRGDIPHWLELFELRWRTQEGGEPLVWTPEAMQTAMVASWPDNLRGLDRCVYQLRLRHGTGATVTPALIAALLPVATEAPPNPARPDKPTREALLAALEAHGGSVRATAKHYERDRRQIYRWMEAYGLR